MAVARREVSWRKETSEPDGPSELQSSGVHAPLATARYLVRRSVARSDREATRSQELEMLPERILAGGELPVHSLD